MSLYTLNYAIVNCLNRSFYACVGLSARRFAHPSMWANVDRCRAHGLNTRCRPFPNHHSTAMHVSSFLGILALVLVSVIADTEVTQFKACTPGQALKKREPAANGGGFWAGSMR